MDYKKTKEQTDAEAVINLENKNKEMLKVLRFYANEENYCDLDAALDPITADGGKKARKIIEK